MDQNILGDRIKTLRMEKGITQAELSQALDKSDSVSRMWELGKSKPDIDTLVKMAEYFNCSTDYLLGVSKYRSTDEQSNFLGDLEVFREDLLKLPNWSKVLYICFEVVASHKKMMTIEPLYKTFSEKCYIIVDTLYSMASVMDRVHFPAFKTVPHVLESELNDLSRDYRNILVSTSALLVLFESQIQEKAQELNLDLNL